MAAANSWRRHSCRRVLATFQSPVPVGGKSSGISADMGTRDWKVPHTRRPASRRYDARSQIPVNRAQSRQIQPNPGKPRPRWCGGEGSKGTDAALGTDAHAPSRIQVNRGKSCCLKSRVPAGPCSTLQSNGAWPSRFPSLRLLFLLAANQSFSEPS